LHVANFELSRTPIAIGSIKRLEVDIDVKNTGEPAFLSQVKFELPAFAPIVRVPKNCIEGRGPSANMLTCDIGNPLPTSSKVRKYPKLSFMRPVRETRKA
jgi:hypothetical protein